ncbi:MGMT family protein [Thalassobacillus sp. CUG 92003]|uniref:MGMT family protein n=1 Tax=Thalassobacillus sp. CUG 92003 TaxID=2736641 RepID=UPI0015E63DA8|nr:methylated-DNA--[protein]-cysteine S-methyltransferase [Thalassobacillus sp. CUG 92003]
MQPFTRQVITIIQSIPPGKVMTYGQIAGCAGNPKAARQVARILHSMSRAHQLPWHRVINAQGKIAIQNSEIYEEQRLALNDEHVDVTSSGTVNLAIYQHHP